MTVDLHLFDGAIQDSTPNPLLHPALVPVETATTNTQKFGEKLHVALVTLTLQRDLDGGKNYSYNVKFVGQSQTWDLKSLGMLAISLNWEERVPLGYDPEFLPSFSLPPSIEQLNIIHCSCRKPHGAGNDAMVIADEWIESLHTFPERRPHQLFLTGDQIYADEIPAALLPELSAVGRALIGVPEYLWVGTAAYEATDENFPPDRRGTLVRETAGFSTDEGESHLLTFGEFCAMHLFAWSNDVWPSVLPGEEILDSSLPPPPTSASLTKIPDKSNERDEYDDYLAERQRVFIDQRAATFEYKMQLPRIRRLLANVPTWMIFDDHEITDDWYFADRWRTDIAGSLLGRAIIRNGMSAYAIFQGWGNDPAYFASGVGASLLADIATFYTTGLTNLNPTDPNTPHPVPLETKLGIDRSPSPVQWHYEVKGTHHHVIVLDTRTQRHYDSETASAGLISDVSLAAQITTPQPSAKATVIISAAPVLGIWVIEEMLQPAYATFKSIRTLSRYQGDLIADVEPWTGDVETYSALLKRLYGLQHVVLLSGDVHYAYSARLTYWQNAANPRRMTQMTSSALKNVPEDLYDIFSGPVGQWAFGGHPSLETFGWEPPAPVITVAPSLSFIPPYVRFRPSLHFTPFVLPKLKWPPTVAASRNSDWSWRLDLVDDVRPDDELAANHRPEVMVPPSLPVEGPDGVSRHTSAAQRHSHHVHKGALRTLLADPNIGGLSFSTRSNGLWARHSVFARHPDAPGVAIEALRHDVPLDDITEGPPTIP